MSNVARPTAADPQPTQAHERVKLVAAGRRSRRPEEQSPAHPPSEERRREPAAPDGPESGANWSPRRTSKRG